MVEKDLFEFSSLEQLNGLESMFGFQFENLVLNNLQTLFPMLGLDTALVLSASPYCQRAAVGRDGCQIDLRSVDDGVFGHIVVRRDNDILTGGSLFLPGAGGDKQQGRRCGQCKYFFHFLELLNRW